MSYDVPALLRAGSQAHSSARWVEAVWRHLSASICLSCYRKFFISHEVKKNGKANNSFKKTIILCIRRFSQGQCSFWILRLHRFSQSQRNLIGTSFYIYVFLSSLPEEWDTFPKLYYIILNFSKFNQDLKIQPGTDTTIKNSGTATLPPSIKSSFSV